MFNIMPGYLRDHKTLKNPENFEIDPTYLRKLLHSVRFQITRHLALEFQITAS